MMPTTVQLLVTCLVDGFYPHVGRATVDVLERLGMTVEFPLDQTCCGQPAFNAGFHDEARAMVKHTIEVLDATEGPIVAPSGSCTAMIVHHASGLVADDEALTAKAQRVADRSHELTSFLVDELGITNVGAACAGCRVAYHPSCHGLRDLGLTHQPHDLLDAVDGLDRIDLPDATECCGFGGLFSVKMPDVSAAILGTKLDNVERSGADVLVGGDVSCLMHLEGGLRRRGSRVRVRHIAEILAGGEW